MPTYLELNREAVWRAQFVPQALNERLILPLRAHYGLGPTLIGAPGDNNHLYGRHRSRNWALASIYCTNRSYGTTDARDKRGDGNWYRAIDIGITGQPLYDACRRVDVAVRAGRLPGLAEWFGTFDGRTVVGWYQGRPSSSDSSHLTHFHGGWWNESANDFAGMNLFFRIFTGTESVPTTVGGDMPGLFKTADSDTLYMSDGFKRKALTGPMWADFKETWGDVPVATVADMAALDAIAGPDWATVVPPSGGLTYEQTVQAAKEGANLAEDS